MQRKAESPTATRESEELTDACLQDSERARFF